MLARLESAENGNLGDVKAVGGGIREIRIHFGPGYQSISLKREKCCFCFFVGAISRHSLATLQRRAEC